MADQPEAASGIFLLRNPTVADVVDVLTRWFDPDQPFLSAASVFTEVGFEQSHDVDGNPFVVMSVLGKPTSSIIAMPGTQAQPSHEQAGTSEPWRCKHGVDTRTCAACGVEDEAFADEHAGLKPKDEVDG